MSETLVKFQDYLKKMDYYNHVGTLMYWDMRTQMPKEGFDACSDALTYFSTEQFKLATAPELKEMLIALNTPEEFDALDSDWQFIVKRMLRDIEKDERIPQDFYTEMVQIQTESEAAWEEAKNAKDFSIFAPHLAKVIEVTKKRVAYTDPGKDVYDALLDQYEEGMDSETIDRIFEELKSELIPLTRQILAAKQPDEEKLAGFYDKDQQKKVQDYLLKYIGFDFAKGCVGESEHPFTLNFSSKDVRVTNHYYEDAPISSMFSAIHEGGHAIFEQNVNPKFDGTVAGSCGYMGIHESQSRFYENVLGRNINFWKPIYEDVQNLLPELKNVSLDDFYREINHVKNSFIRTEADEVTYCFHIILRYEMEKAIFRDQVPVEELPALWNEKMKAYLDLTPADDGEGILQDMHWSDGSFGYFPSYLLGSIYDGLYLEAIEEELGSVDEILANGEIKKITKWLNEKIHQYGSTRLPKEVLDAVCGREVSAKPLMDYFRKKYTEVYSLN
ncbi:MAG: carboxypeptidase M32 [Lachnospiraceae bacterium]|nr:carboxypeptidase M32 [Lachnospiraceae bacterium]